MQKKTKTVEFNVKISDAERKMLGTIADSLKVSMAEVLRVTITQKFRMLFANEPVCISGSPCLCRQMHYIRDADALSDADLLEKVNSENGNG